MPDITKQDEKKLHKDAVKIFWIYVVVPRTVFFGVAFLVFWFGDREKYVARMTGLGDLGYLYAAVYVFSWLEWITNWYTIIPKYALGVEKTELCANQFFYKVNFLANDRKGPLPYVVMESEGMAGKSNRASRALGHFTEHAAGTLALILLAGYVFPFPTFICTLIIFCGRMIYLQVYANQGYKSPLRSLGFVLLVFSQYVLENMVLMSIFGAFKVGVFGKAA